MEFLVNMLGQAVERIADGDGAIWSTTLRTLRFALESTLFALALGLPLGFWLGEARTRPRRAGTVLANAGLGLPPVVLGCSSRCCSCRPRHSGGCSGRARCPP